MFVNDLPFVVEVFNWENEEYNFNQDGPEQDMGPYPELAAEFPGKEMVDGNTAPTVKEDNENNENEKAAKPERNCNLGEIPNQNDKNEQETVIYVEGNPVKLETLEIIDQPFENVRQVKLVEIEEDIQDHE